MVFVNTFHRLLRREMQGFADAVASGHFGGEQGEEGADDPTSDTQPGPGQA